MGLCVCACVSLDSAGGPRRTTRTSRGWTVQMPEYRGTRTSRMLARNWCVCVAGWPLEPPARSPDSGSSGGGPSAAGRGRAYSATGSVPDESWLQPGDVITMPTERELAAMPLSKALDTLREAEKRLLLGLGAVGETWQQRLKCGPVRGTCVCIGHVRQHGSVAKLMQCRCAAVQ